MVKRPTASSPLVSRTMKKVRVKDTDEEMAVRRILFATGLRYRIYYQPKTPNIGRGSIDIAFPKKKLAIFIDGCFWHGCPVHGMVPKANRKWWLKKLAENKGRDSKISRILESDGWTVLRFWTHQSPEEMVTTIIETINRVKI